MLPEQVHVHVALHGPLCACDVPQPGRGQFEGRLAVGKGSDHPGSAPDLAHDAFEGIIGPDAAPMLVGKGVVDEGLGHGLLEPGGYLGKAQGFEIAGHLRCLGLGGRSAFLGVDGLEHEGELPDLAGREMAEGIPVPMDNAALPLGLGIKLRHAPPANRAPLLEETTRLEFTRAASVQMESLSAIQLNG